LRPIFSKGAFAFGSSCGFMALFYHRNRTVAS
jgi:hypothetical protein